MQKIVRDYEEYLNKKFTNLLLEIMEYPPKREIPYLGLCYCQLSKTFDLSEVNLSELKKCLKKYLIEFDSYPWKDYLLELEIFFLREGEDNFIKGKKVMTYAPSDEFVFLSLDPRYSFMKNRLCQKIYKYWFISQKWENSYTVPKSGTEVLETAISLFNEQLYWETSQYLDYYLPYLNGSKELLLYRVLKHLSLIGTMVEKRNTKYAIEEIDSLLEFLRQFKKELKGCKYDIKKLKKDLKQYKKWIGKKRLGYVPPILIIRKQKKFSFGNFIKNLFRKIKA
jgi:hypothetical protein